MLYQTLLKAGYAITWQYMTNVIRNSGDLLSENG